MNYGIRNGPLSLCLNRDGRPNARLCATYALRMHLHSGTSRLFILHLCSEPDRASRQCVRVCVGRKRKRKLFDESMLPQQWRASAAAAAEARNQNGASAIIYWLALLFFCLFALYLLVDCIIDCEYMLIFCIIEEINEYIDCMALRRKLRYDFGGLRVLFAFAVCFFLCRCLRIAFAFVLVGSVRSLAVFADLTCWPT